MANTRRICLLLLLGFVTVATANPFIGRLGFPLFSCVFKRCHPYAKCEVQNNTAVCVCPKACPKNLSPVCGTNWKTYNNYCELRRASCTSNSRTGFRYYGPCKSGSCIHTPWQNLQCPYYSRCQLNFGLPSCVCPQERCSASYSPVCGTDGRTYRSSCQLRKAACKRRRLIRVQHSGHCRPDPCARIDCCCGAKCRVNETNHATCECDFACILLFDPVCGSDGRTYGSACTLRSAACAQQNPRLRVVSDGECPSTSTSTTPMMTSTTPMMTSTTPMMTSTTPMMTSTTPMMTSTTPMMTSTTPMMTSTTITTTTTPCAVKCVFYETCVVVNDTARCVCPSPCAVEKPVCGSNGLTYGNICELQRDSCQNRTSIQVASEGLCPIATTRDDCASVVCPQIVNPVCGSDGVTYGNVCELLKATCVQRRRITVMKNGPCDVNTTTGPMPTTLTPCASTRCGFFARCEVRNGSAGCVCPEICPQFVDPVCGSDGVTYDNTCELQKASCEQEKDIKVVMNGSCVSGVSTTMTPKLSCPPIPRICQVFCDNKECASKGQICCCRGCGNVCTTPVIKAGRKVCPPPENTCSGDDECPSGKKCCRDVCSKRCVTPVPTVDSLTGF